MLAPSGDKIGEVSRQPFDIRASIYLPDPVLSVVETTGEFKSTRAKAFISLILRHYAAVNPSVEGLIFFYHSEYNSLMFISRFSPERQKINFGKEDARKSMILSEYKF